MSSNAASGRNGTGAAEGAADEQHQQAGTPEASGMQSALSGSAGNSGTDEYASDNAEEASQLTEEQAEALLERMVQEAQSMPTGGEGIDAVPPSDPQANEQKEELKRLKDRGNRLFNQKLYSEAVEAYSAALRIARDPGDIAVLASNRSASFASLSQQYRSRPAARSEAAALYGLDPSALAALALKDAARAVSLRPEWAKAHSRHGLALFLCEKYIESREAYLQGLSIEPGNKVLQEGLAEVQAILDQDADAGAGAAAGAVPGGSSSGGGAGAATSPGSGARPSPGGGLKRARTLSRGCDDLECILCMKLLYEPVTTPCGHTFCKGCFARAMDHGNRCPMCRTVLHTGRDLPVTITLASILEKSFPDEYEGRRKEVAEETAASSGGGAAAGAGGGPFQLALFVMSTLMPGEKMSLNIFEPRYRLMIRRCMEGSRRFGMAQVRYHDRQVEPVATEVEIIECQLQPDGRYYLEVQGRRRVRILDHSELDGYRLARVEAFKDAPVEAGSAQAQQLHELATQVSGLAEQFVAQLRRIAATQARGARIRSLLDDAGDKPPPDQPEKLSFWVAALAATFVSEVAHDRMSYLESTDTAARLTRLRERLVSSAGTASGSCCVM